MRVTFEMLYQTAIQSFECLNSKNRSIAIDHCAFEINLQNLYNNKQILKQLHLLNAEFFS